MTFAVLMDFLVAGLLVATIVYCVLLNRRLAALRSDKSKLEEAIQGLHGMSLRAEAGITALRQAAEDIGRQLQQKIELAQTLRDDLAYMVDRSGGVADRLEGVIRTHRQATTPPQSAAEEPPAPRPAEQKRREPARPAPKQPAESVAAGEKPPTRVAGFPSRAERELRRVLDARR
jgi:Domain of unknown function (DUF6468)